MSTLYPNSRYTLLERAKDTIDGKTVLPMIQTMNRMGVDDFFMAYPGQFPPSETMNRTKSSVEGASKTGN